MLICCKEADGYRAPNGYVKVGREYAHRKAYREHFGVGKAGMRGLVVMHACDNPACVEPAHLMLGTQKQNMADKVLKGRQAKGERVAGSKLNDVAVASMRARYRQGVRQSVLAEEFGISQGQVSRIVNARLWAHVMEA